MKFLERLHPLVSFLYLVLVLFFAMFTMHPVPVVTVFLSGVVLFAILDGAKALLKSLIYSLPLMALVTLTNPLFVHKGRTVLFFLGEDPVTKEALLYGFFASLMIFGVFYWCRCFSYVMSGDKLIYIFGRILPKLSLLLSMTLAAIPRLKKRYREIDEAQQGLGVYGTGSAYDTLRGKLRVFSVLVSLSLEGSVETADSMRARGYGLKGRSAYSLYRFRREDGVFLALLLLIGGTVFALLLSGAGAYRYYPVPDSLSLAPTSLALYLLITLFVGLSIIFETKEVLMWRYLKSKI